MYENIFTLLIKQILLWYKKAINDSVLQRYKIITLIAISHGVQGKTKIEQLYEILWHNNGYINISDFEEITV